jgi:alpha-glucosidase
MINWTPRHLRISLAHLGNDHWEADVYNDDQDAARIPTDIMHSQMSARSSRPLNIDLAQGGGWAARLKPLEK